MIALFKDIGQTINVIGIVIPDIMMHRAGTRSASLGWQGLIRANICKDTGAKIVIMMFASNALFIFRNWRSD